MSATRIFVFIAVAALAMPLTSEAAPAISIKENIRVEVNPSAHTKEVPLILISGVQSSNLKLTYANLPETAKIVIAETNSKRQEGTWEFRMGTSPNDELSLAMPARLARGKYVLRAVSIESGKTLAESASFFADGKGRLTLDTSSRSIATYRAWSTVGGFYEHFGVTEKRAREICARDMRRNQGVGFLCTWNGSSLPR